MDHSTYIKKSLSGISQAQIVILRGSESQSSKGRDMQQQLSHSNLRSWSFRFTSDIGMIQTKCASPISARWICCQQGMLKTFPDLLAALLMICNPRFQNFVHYTRDTQ